LVAERHKILLISALLLFAGLLTVHPPFAEAAVQKDHFCWGVTLTPKDTHSETDECISLHFGILEAEAWSPQHSVCLEFTSAPHERSCSSGPENHVAIKSPISCSECAAFLRISNNAESSSTVYGNVTYLDGKGESVPPPSPTWHTDNLGGSILSDPDIASWGVGHWAVFGQGTNEYLHAKTFQSEYWGTWENLGGPVLTSGPGSVSWGYKRLDVVGRSTTGTLAHWWYDGTWHNEDQGGAIVGSPDISSWGSGRLDVFARGTNDYLHHKWYTPATGWSAWENLGGPTLSSGPGAVSWGENRIDAVGRAPDGSVAHWWYDGSWHVDNLGGAIVGSPDISSWGSGRLDVFARGTNDYLHHKWYTPATGWSAWENLGGPTLSSGPGAVSGSSGRIDVVGRASDGSVAHWWYAP
jgi:Repeat of unknown function (DUF346)